ncbi:MAG: recombinase RecT [Propionibacteriaceae bacterium]|nr:MAG: recombinase RecT [Propionibacteriaceae bacterium]
MPSQDLQNRARGNPRGNAPATQRGQAPDSRQASVDQLRRYAQDFATVLPSHLDAKQWLRLAEGLLRRDPTLAAVSIANPASFFAALLECARLGLVPGDTYHLVAFGRDVVGITDYKGEIELMYRAGMVQSIVCEVVYERDLFRFKPGDEKPDHTVDWFDSDRGAMKGVYAYARLKDGGTSRVAILNREGVEAIKAVSKTARRPDSPWNKWPDRMWRKTALKQLTAWVPSSAEFRSEQLRAESAAIALPSGFGQLPPTPDYPELPPAPQQIEDGVDTVTGEVLDAPAEQQQPQQERPAVAAAVAAAAPDVTDELPEDYDPTEDPTFGQEG